MRPKGDGSVYQLADGRWVAQIEDGYTASGSRRYRRRTKATETAARQAVRDMLRDANRGAAGLDPRMTVKRWSDEWLLMQQTRLRPDALTTTAGHVRRWIVPAIGNRRLNGLSAADARKIDRSVLAAGRSPTTAHHVHVTLLTMLRAAIAEGHAVPEPIMAVTIPAMAPSERGAIPLGDAIALLNTALNPAEWPAQPDLPPLGRGRKRDPELVALHNRRRLATTVDPSRWTAALLQGMRQAECLGLTWDRVDLDSGVMDVSWQLKRIKAGAPIPATLRIQRLDGNYALTAPKTKAGQRIIPLVPWMITALQRWKDDCPSSAHDLVWARPSGGPMSKGDALASWRGLQEAADVAKAPGEHWLLHEARHTTVSLLEAANVPPAVIIAIVGHASYASTRRYAHADVEQARAALGQVATALGLDQ